MVMKTYIIGIHYEEDGYREFICGADSVEEVIELGELEYLPDNTYILFITEVDPSKY